MYRVSYAGLVDVIYNNIDVLYAFGLKSVEIPRDNVKELKLTNVLNQSKYLTVRESQNTIMARIEDYYSGEIRIQTEDGKIDKGCPTMGSAGYCALRYILFDGFLGRIVPMEFLQMNQWDME